MLKLATFLSRFIPCCAAANSDPDTTRALLSPEHIGILSASCCDRSAQAKDAQLSANVAQALEQTGDSRTVVMSTITTAQSHLASLQADANPVQQRLIDTVAALFQAHGLSIFPMLIIDGRVAFYGGVPTAAMIGQALQAQPAAAATLR